MKKYVHKDDSDLDTEQHSAQYMAGGRGEGELIPGTNHFASHLFREKH